MNARLSRFSYVWPRIIPGLALLFVTLAHGPASTSAADRPPNFVVIFCDDLGYADIGPFGAKGYATPHLDQMAKEGMRLTSFEVAAAVCSASRVALLTGCYPQRVGFWERSAPPRSTGSTTTKCSCPRF